MQDFVMRILLLMTLFIFTSSASAGLYKWVDGDGNVHYSQKPPRDKQYKRLKAPAPAPETTQPLYKSTKKTDKTAKTLAAESAKNQKLRETNCTNAKEHLNKYTLYRRFRDKDGNVTTVNDNERAKQIKEAKQAINDFCN